MNGYEHLLVGLIFSAALVFGSLLPDLDHNCGSLNKKVSAFFGLNECGERSGLHKPLVILGMAVCFLGLGLGLLLHIIMDFVLGIGG